MLNRLVQHRVLSLILSYPSVHRHFTSYKLCHRKRILPPHQKPVLRLRKSISYHNVVFYSESRFFSRPRGRPAKKIVKSSELIDDETHEAYVNFIRSDFS